jgi:iron complex transport system substrate-binding protein
VFAAGPPAAALVYVLAPDRLLGWPNRLDAGGSDWLPPSAARLPVLGRLAGRGSTVSFESLVGLQPDLVLDVGTVDATHASTIERVRQQTGLRCELLDGRLADTPALLRKAGRLLGVEDRAEMLATEAERILADVAGARGALSGTRVYLARGADGLETGLAGSINTEIVEWVGARNVAAEAGTGGLTRVSLEQVLAWNPAVLLTQESAFARTVRADPLWQGIDAVRSGRILCAPTAPFGWLDSPPGVNRLIGALWLSRRLRPSPGADDLAVRVRSFYDLFYGIVLSEARLRSLLDWAA